jgi:hypothetical protein
MPEIARLNLTGPVYDPMKGMSQESMSEKIRKNRQAVLSAALSAYQIKGEQHKIEAYEVMQRTDEFMAHYGKDFFNNSANVLKPDSWKFTDPNMRHNMLKQWKSQVGGNYKGFSAAYEMAKQNEMNAMAKSMLRGRAGERTDREYASKFAEQLDLMTDQQKQTLFENVSPEVYTQMMTLYVAGGGGPQGQDQTEGLWGFDLKNDIGDILVENFDIDRDDYDDWVDDITSKPGEAFIPEHWRDAYRAFNTGEMDEFTNDEEWKWTQVPAYIVEFWLFKKFGKKGAQKLFGKGGIFRGKDKTGGGTSSDVVKKAADTKYKQPGAIPGKGKQPSRKTPEQLIKEYKGAKAPTGAKINTKSKWYGVDAPKLQDYKNTKTWMQAFRSWKRANGFPADPSKIIMSKANPSMTKNMSMVTGGKGGIKTPPAVTSEAAAKLTMPANKIGAAEKEIAEKLASGSVNAAEAQKAREALQKLAKAGDPITNANMTKILEQSGGGKSLLAKVRGGAFKFAVLPIGGYMVGSEVFGGIGGVLGGEKGEQVGEIIGGTTGAVTANATFGLLKRAYNKHGLSWILTRIIKKGGVGLAARTLGKGALGAFGASFSGPISIALMTAWLASDAYAIYNILQEAEASGEL